MADFPEVVYWQALIQDSGLKLNVLKPMILRWCLTDNRQLADLFTLSGLELSTTFGLSEAEVGQLRHVAKKLPAHAGLLEKWQKEGIEPIIRTDIRYPRRLVYHLSLVMQPLILWTQGNPNLLNQPAVTMLGQPEANSETTAFVDELINTLEVEQIGLISGYSRGLDRTTFEMMLTTEQGFTVAMLPMGLSAFAKTTNKLSAAVYGGRTLLVSPFAPDAAYHDKLAEARNLLIDHLTLALLILESDDESQARAVAAISRGLPVFVRRDTASNRELLGSGALLLTDPGEVVDWVQQAIVDDVMQETDDETPSATEYPIPSPANMPPHLAVDPADDYSLRAEVVPPIDGEEALNLLQLGGAPIPEVLRRKLEKSAANDNS